MDRNNNWVNITIKLALAITIVCILALSFCNSTPRFSISKELCYVIVLGIVLLVSESVESFTFGDIISLKKEVKQKKEDNAKLTEENKILRDQLISIYSVSVNNQQTQKTNVNIAVQSATNEDQQEAEANDTAMLTKEQLEDDLKASQNNKESSPLHGAERIELIRKIQKVVLKKYIESINVDPRLIQYGVKFYTENMVPNLIMKRNAVFDAYIKRPLDELFINSKCNMTSMLYDQNLYYLVSEILNYQQYNHTKAKLVVLVPEFSSHFMKEKLGKPMSSEMVKRNVKRLTDKFEPSIQSGLLEFVTIPLSKEECSLLTEPK